MFLPLKDDNPLNRIGFQFVTVALIAACTIVWIVQAVGGDQFDAELVFRLGMIPVTVLGELRREPDMITISPWLTIVTSMFLHGGFWHLFGNMIYLWIFGDNVEDSMGHWRFALFYLLCGTVAGLTHAAVESASQIPTIGASGAVSGVLGAYLMLHPRRGVWLLVFFMPLRFPAWGVLGVWIGYQVINALTAGPAGGGVAWYAHIGGFAAGALLVVPMRKRGVPLFDRGYRRLPQADAIPAAAGGRERRRRAMGGAGCRSACRSGDRGRQSGRRRPRDAADGAGESGRPAAARTGPWGRRPRPRPWSRRD